MNLHLLKMFPDQIAKYWYELCPMVEESLPPMTDSNADNRMTGVLQALLAGRLEMFQFYDQNENEEAKIIGLAILSVVENIDYTSKDLLIYSVYAYGPTSRAEVVGGFKLIAEYAKGIGCTAVTAYTTLPGLIRYIKSLGGSTDYTFLRLEV